MVEPTSELLEDLNKHPFQTLDSFNVVKTTANLTAFTGSTNERGGFGETDDPHTLFTVTGDVLVAVIGVVTTDLVSAGGGTLSVGTADDTDLILPTTTATALDDGEVWTDGTPNNGKSLDSLNFYLLGDGADIVEDVGTADITAGNLYYICLWRPLTPGSKVVTAD